MKKIVFILFCFQFNGIAAQEIGYAIKYKVALRFGANRNFIGFLNSSSNMANFRFKELLDQTSTFTKEKNQINFELRDSTEMYIISDLRTKELIETNKLPPSKELYLIHDTAIFINWAISNERKIINNHLLVKAFGEFRGRTYTAWFCPDLPTVIGPWKFHGLPGVVFEISDSKKEIEFILEELQTDIQFIPIVLPKGISISRSLFRKKQNAIADEISKSLTSKLGREMTVEVKVNNLKQIELD